MLDANPNLTYRDVQEILVRSSRQTAQFEIPATEPGSKRTLQHVANESDDSVSGSRFVGHRSYFASTHFYNPIADPTLTSFPYSDADFAFSSIPTRATTLTGNWRSLRAATGRFTNGAGYTVSQGYGAYGELIGYGHGVIDAELAVIMARDWHTLNQDIAPSTEKTLHHVY